MLITSLNFILFFLITIFLYFKFSPRFRITFLLLASYFFYSTYKIEYLSILIFLTVINFYIGILIEKKEFKKKNFLLIGLLSNICILCWFKYADFKWIASLFPNFSVIKTLSSIDIILPVGLSFYTFKIMNYIIDVYRGNIRAERNIINFALFVSFFPQIIAGPIERATNLLPQFDVEKKFDSRRIADGMKLMLWGFFQKVVIADNLAVFVDAVYKNPREYGGFILILATIFFTFQIFCDFSGYSDIAIGAAQVFGFNSIQNFNRPYFSQSIPEFWRRWHISLTSWFRDYLYIPLGGNRVSKPRWYLNIFIVFLISGLWHGSTWTFALWGAIHGIYYLFSLFTKDLREKIVHVLWLQKFPAIHTLIKTVITFILVSFAWIFFRGNNIHDTLYIVTSLFSKWKIDNCSIKLLSTYYFEIFVGTSSIIFLLVIQYLQKDIKFKEWIMKKPIYFRWIIYYTGIVTILLFGNLGVKQFIYFKF